MCREVINCDVDALGSAPPPKELLAARQFELTEELRELQQRMAVLFQHQQSRGGIIDVDADSSKLLLLTSEDGASAVGPLLFKLLDHALIFILRF